MPTPIPAVSIASEVQAANFRLRRIALELDKAVELSDVERQLEVLAASLEQIRPVLESGDKLQNEELFNFRQELTQLSFRLDELQQQLAPRSRVLEERREELLKMAVLWIVTYQSLAGQEAPGSSRDLIRSTQKRIDETLAVIRTYRPVLLTIQDRVSEQRITADVLLARTNDAIDELRRRLLSIDTAPLWRAVRSAKAWTPGAESFRQSYLRRARPLFDYVKDNQWRLWLHLAISSLLIWFLIVVSRGGRDLQTRDDRKSAVLRHPIAAALVVSLLLSFRVYPNAPLTMYRLPLLLMVFPLARVVSGTLPRDQRPIFYFFTGLYILWRLEGLVSSADFVFRIFLLVLACLGIAGALWGARMDRKAARTTRGWGTARLQMLRLAAVILLASLIANIVGNMSLATLLAGACISSAYAAAAIYAGVLVLEGFILPLFQSPKAQMSVAVRERSQQFQRRSSFVIRTAALLGWVAATLAMFAVWAPVLEWLSSLLFRKWSFGRLAFSLGGILLFLVTILLSYWVARVAAFVAEKDILSRMKLPQGVPETVSMLVRELIIGAGFVLALAGAGVQWSQVALVAGAIGLGIGFGLQQLAASFIAGLILIFERPIRLGDIVEIGNVVGVVSRIGLRSSTVAVFDGSELICPNNRLISEDLVNWTLSNQVRRVELQVEVARGSDPDVVLAVLKREACGHPGVLQNPEASVLFTGFGESSLTFVVRFYSPFGTWITLRSEIGIRINQALREEGIEIALPRREIRVEREPAAAPIEPREQGATVPGLVTRP